MRLNAARQGASLGGRRGGGSGENTTPWLSSRETWGSEGPPDIGSPPLVTVTEEGVVSRVVGSPAPPLPAPKSAVRPPCGVPSALARTAASVRSASFASKGRRKSRGSPDGKLS